MGVYSVTLTASNVLGPGSQAQHNLTVLDPNPAGTRFFVNAAGLESKGENLYVDAGYNTIGL